MDKINFSNINPISDKQQPQKKPFRLGLRIDSFVRSSNNSPKTETEKSKETKMTGQSFSREDIVNVLVDYRFSNLVENLIAKKSANNYKSGIIINQKSDGEYYFRLGVLNNETLKNEYYDYSVDEFSEIFSEVKEKNLKKYPEEKDSINALASKFMEFLDSLKKPED